MLEQGRQAADRAGFGARVRFHEALLPQGSAPRRSYDLIFSNALLHHLEDPAVLWSSACRWSGPDTLLFVMDLMRPESRDHAQELVDRYACNEPDVLRTDFYTRCWQPIARRRCASSSGEPRSATSRSRWYPIATSSSGVPSAPRIGLLPKIRR